MARQIPIGKMRIPITVEVLTEGAVDAMNMPTKTWATSFPAWARMRTLSAEERLEAAQVGAKRTISFVMPYRDTPTVVASMRLKARGRTFNIESVVNIDEEDRYLDLKCHEIVTGASV